MNRLNTSINSRFTSVNSQLFRLFAIGFAGILFVLFKLNGTHINDSLWAEDGAIFVNQAREFGISSIWITYAGYFHLYPRIIAWLSSFLDIGLTPLFFFIMWFLAYIALLYVAINRALYYGINIYTAIFLSILLVAQPHSGEVFFTLTNAQWFIGGALSIYVLAPVKDKSSICEKSLLLLASLTGPFSLILSPLLLIQWLIYQDWKDRKFIYILVAIGAMVQFSSILLSNRIVEDGFDRNISNWFRAIFAFLNFGGKTTTSIVIAILFWTLASYILIKIFGRNIRRNHHSLAIVVMFFMAAAGLYFIAGLIASKSHPHWLNPLGGGGRYFFIPYLLIFFSSGLMTLIITRLKYAIYGLIFLLSVVNFTNFQRNNLQFIAFTEFAKQKNNIIVPINPQWEEYPSWHIRLFNNNSNEIQNSNTHLLKLVHSENVKSNKTSSKIYSSPTSIDPQLFYDISKKCIDADNLGIEIHITRIKNGWAQLFWSNSEDFSENQSLRRFYPSGSQIMQFAFPAKGVNNLRFDPLENEGDFFIDSTELYCLRG